MDYHEHNLRRGNGVKIKTDMYNPDSDGDGILDGDKVKVRFDAQGKLWHVTLNSHPGMIDSIYMKVGICMIKGFFIKHKHSKVIAWILIIVVLILLFKPVYDDMYNRYHLWRKDYPTSYVKTILRQNKKHYQRVADYATSDAILNDYVGEYYSGECFEYDIGLYDENLKIRYEKVIKSLDKVTEAQTLWVTYAKKMRNKPCFVEFEFTPHGVEPDGSDNWLRYYQEIDLETYNSLINYGFEDLGDGWLYYNRLKNQK